MNIITTVMTPELLQEARSLFVDHPYLQVLDDLASDLNGGHPPLLTVEAREADDLVALATATAPLSDRAPWTLLVLTNGSPETIEAMLTTALDGVPQGIDIEWWDRGPSLVATATVARSRGMKPGRRIERMERTDLTVGRSVSTRPADRGDLGRVAEINNAAFVGHADRAAWTTDTVIAELALVGPIGDLRLAPTEPTALGFVWTKALPDSRGEIYVLATHPDGRGMGLGSGLLEAGIEHLTKTYGVRTVVLYVDSDNLRAIKLYEHHGFDIVEGAALVSHRFDTRVQ